MESQLDTSQKRNDAYQVINPEPIQNSNLKTNFGSISDMLTHDFFAVTFKLKFETKFGESLSIVGSNE